jgi:hypothetical protein
MPRPVGSIRYDAGQRRTGLGRGCPDARARQRQGNVGHLDVGEISRDLVLRDERIAEIVDGPADTEHHLTRRIVRTIIDRPESMMRTRVGRCVEN